MSAPPQIPPGSPGSPGAPAHARRAADSGPGHRRQADSRPGWYPDPDGDRDVWRWWTGQDWTAWLADRPDAPPPPFGRREWGPRASETVTPLTGRFGAATGVAMGLVLLLILVSAAVVVGWPRRHDAALTAGSPTGSFQPADLSVVCENTRLVVGGALGVEVPAEMSTSGPSFSKPLGNLQCRGRLPDEKGGNTLLSLGLASSEQASGTVREQAEAAFRTLEQELYSGGPAQSKDVTGAAAEQYGNAWRITASLLGPRATVRDAFELIVVDLGQGRRAVWILVVGDKVSPQGRAELEKVRNSLRLA